MIGILRIVLLAMHDFCTCFDINYAARGLAMCESLIGVSRGELVRVFVLCLDEEVFELLNLYERPGIVPVPLAGIEQHDPSLLTAKNNRSKVEYYFTLSSCLVHFLLNTRKDVTLLTYLDADLFFFSPWDVLFKEMGASSIMVIPHRFPDRLRHLEQGGLFNVGWISIRNDQAGLGCVKWWRDRCLEWCYDRHEDGKFADQKYLDSWPAMFPGVRVCQNIGANVAPWNVEQYRLTRVREGVLINHTPLVFYHSQGYQWVGPKLIEPGLAGYGRFASKEVAQLILLPYAREVVSLTHRLVKRYPGFRIGAGNTRVWERQGYGKLYSLRLILEGRVMVQIRNKVIYIRCETFRRGLALWDRIHGRSTGTPRL